MRLHLTRQCRRPHSLDLINAAPAVREPKHVDEARSRLDLDQARMVEQLASAGSGYIIAIAIAR